MRPGLSRYEIGSYRIDARVGGSFGEQVRAAFKIDLSHDNVLDLIQIAWTSKVRSRSTKASLCIFENADAFLKFCSLQALVRRCGIGELAQDLASPALTRRSAFKS